MLLILKSDKELAKITKKDLRLANPILRQKSQRVKFLALLLDFVILGMAAFNVFYAFFHQEKAASIALITLTLLSLSVFWGEIYYRCLQKLGQEAERMKIKFQTNNSKENQ